jgi:hypothetical protein
MTSRIVALAVLDRAITVALNIGTTEDKHPTNCYGTKSD